ncbi:MAG TPA: hypothetical protein PKK00_05955 [Bacteroidales bacterium]|nr:hypothetical protein [Bacteroidales bacterium]HPS16825.1 hypothetical protein [Bacteroidales bacterium]
MKNLILISAIMMFLFVNVKAQQLETITGATGAPTKGTITGTGTTGYIPKFSSAYVIGNSNIFQSGSNIGIGTTGPTEKLEVSGKIKGTQLVSTIATGTSPFTITSTTVSTNLNADLLDGYHANSFQTALTNPVTGTGTANYITKWTGTNTVGASSLIFDNGTNVGIGTTSPLSKVQIGNGITKVSLGDCYGEPIGWGTSYIGFNLSKTIAGTWTTESDGGSNGGSLIYGNIGGGIYFSNIPNTNTSSSQTGITDATIKNNIVMSISSTGDVAIGSGLQTYVNGIQYKLAVKGGIICEQVKVINDVPHSDFVFDSNYKLMSLDQIEKYVKVNKHLPEVPSATEFKENGYNVGEMDNLLLRKVEELTLYIINLQKQNDEMKSRISDLENK